jgi:HK97 family phage major capsid protein
MNKENQKIEYRAVELDQSTINETERTFEITFSTETPVQRNSLVEILDHGQNSVDLSILNSQARVFVEHSTDVRDQIGAIINSWIDSATRRGKALIRLGQSKTAKDILDNINAGVFPGISVGYVINDFIEESKNVFRVTKWSPFEISTVGLAADVNAGFFRSLEKDEKTLEINNQDKLTLHREKEKNPMEQQTIETRAAEPVIDVQKFIAEERKRSSDINALADAFSYIENIRSIAQDSISKGDSVADFQSQILSKVQATRTTESIKFGQAIEVKDNVENDPKKGFRNFGEFTSLVIATSRGNGIPSEIQKRAAPSVFANVTNGDAGGYAIPEGFANEILDVKTDQTSLLQFANQTPVNGNNMTFPFNEKQPWSGGVQAFWRNEGDAATQSKPTLNRLRLDLEPLTALCPVTDEMLADSTAMAQFLQNNMNEAIVWKLNNAIINGTGTDQPLGILTSSGTVSVAKESAQAADTIVAKNLANMYGRMIKQGGNLVWIAHPDTFAQIITLTLGDKSIWSDNFKDMPNGALLGKPLVLSDACATLGDKGDIILADMNGYYAITKAGGAEFAQSMHLWFDQSIQAFRLTFRMDGSPILNTAITPAKGTNSRGFFATVDARA